MNIPLNIDWQQILLHLFNFAILFGGLYLLLFKPVKDFMDKRKNDIQKAQDDTLEAKENAIKLEKEYKAKLDAADDEIAQKKAEAAEESKKLAADTIAEAQAQKESIIAEAKAVAKREQQKAVMDAKEEIAALAVAAAKKIITEEANHE